MEILNILLRGLVVETLKKKYMWKITVANRYGKTTYNGIVWLEYKDLNRISRRNQFFLTMDTERDMADRFSSI